MNRDHEIRIFGPILADAAGAHGAHGARSLLQALTLRLATATRPGTVRFALADPVGQGRHLSAFLRLPAQMRVGPNGVGVAASPAETEALLTTLTSHVVEVTQTRLTNVYDSVEAYNAATTGATVPYHVLVLVGFPAGISDRAAELLGKGSRLKTVALISGRTAPEGQRMGHAGAIISGNRGTAKSKEEAFRKAAISAIGCQD